jgi:uncharacterized damage-inducible protein DinB
MIPDGELLKTMMRRILAGTDAHVQAAQALEDLSWKDAGAQPPESPYTVFQLLQHMIYWQNWTLRWLDGENPQLPRHASMSWPGDARPKDHHHWTHSVKSFLHGLEELIQRSHQKESVEKGRRWSRPDMIQIISSHNSYHLGQIVLIRRMLGAWPPPSGGDTW